MSFGGHTRGEQQDTARLLRALERIGDALEEIARLWREAATEEEA